MKNAHLASRTPHRVSRISHLMVCLTFAIFFSSIAYSQTITASADTYLKGGSANQNQGTATILRIQQTGPNRSLVRITQSQISSAVGSGSLVSATLQVYIQTNSNNWGSSGGLVDVNRLLSDWTESGATWNCAIDSNPNNSNAECGTQWNGGNYSAEPTSSVLHTNGLSGWVSFDVTPDVAAFMAGASNYGWIIKKNNESQSGQVDYASRQGSASTAPRLVLLVESATSDAVPPRLQITAPTSPVLINVTSPEIDLSYSDGGSGVNLTSLRVLLDGTDIAATCTKNSGSAVCIPPALGAGNHTIAAQLSDVAGNSASASFAFKILLGQGPHTSTLNAIADTYLREGSPDKNQGNESILRVRSSGNNRALARFSQSDIAALLAGNTLISASLRLFIQTNANNWGSTGRTVEAHRITADWTEPAATWNCGFDTNPNNQQPDCPSPWSGGTFASTATATINHINGQTGWISYDVTNDVASFLANTPNYGWLIKKTNESQPGLVEYTSREGTGTQVPQLVLVFQTTAGSGDTTGPEIIITGATEGQVFATDAVITVTITDPSGVSSQTITLDGAPFVSGTVVGSEGLHTLVATAQDTAGNPSSRTLHFKIDKTPPSIVVTGVEPDQFYAHPTVITVNITDANLTASTIQLDGVPFVSGTTVATEGQHDLVVTAVDAAGHSSAKHVAFGVDTTPPTVTISSPAEDLTTRFDSIQVTGAYNEQFLHEIKVNDVRATAGGSQYTASGIHLNDGDNTILVVITDLAGNSAQRSVVVHLDRTAPGITITSPEDGGRADASHIQVGGTVTGSDVSGVTVNGVVATLTGTAFSASNVALSEGPNTITAIAMDQAGNTQQASVHVTLDTIGPRITISQPLDGSLTSAASTVVAGTTSEPDGSVTVNETPVSVAANGAFQTTVNLAEGTNVIAIEAQDAAGNHSTSRITVTRDGTAPAVIQIVPMDGSLGVPVDQVLQVKFSEELKPATVNSNTVVLQTNGNQVAGEIQLLGDHLTFTPLHDLSGANTYTLTVTTGITDRIGNPLTATVTSTFNTVDSVAPPAPVIDPPLPPTTSETSITIAGAAESNARIEITGGAARAVTIASGTGHFSAQVTLFPNAVNQLTVIASDISGNTSAPTSATVIQDSLNMVALDASYQPDGTLLIAFSKPVALASITNENLFVTSTTTVTGTVASTADPTVIAFTPQSSLGSNPFVLLIQTSVTDISGNSLEYPFSKSFNTGAGAAFVVGEVFDNATSLPLAGAIVTQQFPAATPPPTTTTDLNGQFILPVFAGSTALHIERGGFVSVDRLQNVPAGQAFTVFDARLQPSDSAILQITSEAASISNSDSSVVLQVPAGAVNSGSSTMLTGLDGQSLPLPLPDGWSAAGVASIDSTANFLLPVTVSVVNDHNLPANSGAATAYFDAASIQWKFGPPGVVTADGTRLEVETTHSGTLAWIIPDSINPPAFGAPDQPVPSAPVVTPQTPGPATLTSTPQGIYPEQRSRVKVTFSGNPLRSGTPFQAVLSENYQLLGGVGSVITIPRTEDLISYSYGSASSSELQFYASPSRAIDFATLDSGLLNVDIHSFPSIPQQPGIIGPTGGTVISSEGDLHLTVPAGALSSSLPVTITSLSASDVGLPLPGYSLVTAFNANFAGATLLLPATLDAPATLAPSGQCILARLVVAGASSRWVLEGTAGYDGNRITTIAGPASLRGILVGGTYGLFEASTPIGFLSGTITDPSGSPAGAGILVTTDASQLSAFSNPSSIYTVATPLGSGTATASNTITGDSGNSTFMIAVAGSVISLSIHIGTTPPQIVSIAPAAGATGVATNTAIRATFSEPILSSTLNASSFFVQSSSGSPISGSILLTANNTAAVFTPYSALDPDTQYVVNVTNGITDLTHNALANPTSSHSFQTKDDSGPDPENATFRLFLPEGPDAPQSGSVRMQVDAAALEPGIALVFFNDTQRTSISAILQGSFYTASLSGRITDKYFVNLIDIAGNTTRVDLVQMQYPDGSGAVFTSAGGTFTTSEDFIISIDPGTFNTAVPVRLQSLAIAEDHLPPHRDFAPMKHFILDLNGATAHKEITISIPAPLEITDSSQVFVMKPVNVFGTKKFMAVEIMHLENGRLTTQSPPWSGIRNPASDETDAYSVAVATDPMYYLRGSVGSLPAIVQSDISDLVSLLTEDTHFILPMPVNEDYILTVQDANTGETEYSGEPAPPATELSGTVQLQQPLSPDHEPPYVIGGAPMTFTSWRVASAVGDIRSKIRFAATDSNDDGAADITGQLTITGDAGALPKGAAVTIHNNASDVEQDAIAADDGSFTLAIAYTFGDPVTLLLSSVDVEPAAHIRLKFSEPLDNSSDYGELWKLYETDSTSTFTTFVAQRRESNQIVDLILHSSLKADTDYTLELTSLSDLTGNTAPAAGKPPQKIRFHTRDFPIEGEGSSGQINDTLLVADHLIVAKGTGIEVWSLENPFSPTHIADLDFVEGARSLALATCGASTRCLVEVGGGSQPSDGYLRLIDLADFSHPAMLQAFKLSLWIGEIDPENPYRQGRPLKLLIKAGKAFIANLGIGVQVVDLSRLNIPAYHTDVHPVFEEPNLKDIALYTKGDPANPTTLDVLFSGISMHSRINDQNIPVSFKVFDANSGAGREISHLQSSLLPGPANNIEVFQDFSIDIDQDGHTGAAEDEDDSQADDGIRSVRDLDHTGIYTFEKHDLAFIASGPYGIQVLDITNLSDDCVPLGECTPIPVLLGTIHLGVTQDGIDSVSAFDLKLDRLNKRLYVPAGGAGIYIVDVSDPFLINHEPETMSQIIGHIDLDAGMTADGEVTVDEELNTIYVGTEHGFRSIMVGNIRLTIETQDDDGDQLAGLITPEGWLDETGKAWPSGTPLATMKAQPAKKYVVKAYLPSGSGHNDQGTLEVTAHISSLTRSDQPLHLAPGFPDTEFDIPLRKQAIAAGQQSYRLYESDPFYITAHPLLPDRTAIGDDAKVLAAGDRITADITETLNFIPQDQRETLLRRSAFATDAVRMEYIDSETPEPRQNPAMGTGETAFPPYLHSGEFVLPAIDFSIKGRGFDFTFARKYESQSLYDGPLGQNWDSPYFARILELPTGDVWFFDGSGRKELFKYRGQQDQACSVLHDCYDSPTGNFSVLRKQIDGLFVLQDPDGTHSSFDRFGRMVQVMDRNENKMEFLYDPSGNLSMIADTLGRPVHFAYDDKGKVTTITDFAGRKWTYEYDSNDEHLLSKVSTPPVSSSIGNDFPTGKSTQYTYDGGTDLKVQANLLSLINGRNQAVFMNTYTQGRLTAQKLAPHSNPIQIAYSANQASVTDGNQNTFVYELTPEGRASSFKVPLPQGGVAITAYEYNPEGLVTKVTMPMGRTVESVYDETNPFRRSQSNLKTETITPDVRGDGGEESGNTPIVQTFQYNDTNNIAISSTDAKQNTTNYHLDPPARNVISVEYPEVPGAEPIVEKFQFNKFGQLIEHTDPIGNHDTYEYFSEKLSSPSAIRETDPDTGGYLKAVTMASESSTNEGQIGDASPAQTSFEYDERGNGISVTDARGVSNKNEYNILDQVVKSTQATTPSTDGEAPLNIQTEYRYDADDNITSVRIPKIFASEESNTQFEYDELNRQTSITQNSVGDTFVSRYIYDARGNRTRTIYPSNTRQPTDVTYDARNLVLTRTEGSGADMGQYSYIYDDEGGLLTEIDPDGVAVNYEQDGFARLRKTLFTAGNSTQKVYDPNGNITKVQVLDSDDTRVAETISSYDSLNRLLKTSEAIIPDPDALVSADTFYHYDSNSRLIQVDNPRQFSTQFDYDGLDRLRDQIDVADNEVELTHDGNGNIIEQKEIDRSGGASDEKTTTFRYDAANRRLEMRGPEGELVLTAYDERGNPLLVTQAQSQGDDGSVAVTAFTYDGLDRKRTQDSQSEVTSGCNQPIVFSYDKNSLLQTYTDPCGATTVSVYDSQDRLKEIDYPSVDSTSSKLVRQYRGGGSQLAKLIDRNGTQIIPIYDVNGRIHQESMQLASGVSGTTLETYAYDALNRTIHAQDNDSSVDLQYNSLGHLLSETRDGIVISAHYDKMGNRKSIHYPNGMVLSSEYDNLNRPKNYFADSFPVVSNQDYLGAVRLHSRTFGNHTNLLVEYDPKRRVQEMKYLGSGNGSFDGRHFGYDAADNKTLASYPFRPQLKDTHEYTLANPAQMKRSIKSLPQAQPNGRLTFVPFAESYTLDKANRMGAVTNDNEGRNFQFNALNQVKASHSNIEGDVLISYDANGNEIAQDRIAGESTIPVRKISYDYRNHPVLVSLYNPQGQPVTTIEYRYDAFGRRIDKISSATGETQYLNFGNDVLVERDGAGVEKASFVYAGIDQPLAMFRNTTDPVHTVYYHTDDIGNVTSITGELGQVLERYYYTGYGVPQITGDSEPPEVLRITYNAGQHPSYDVEFSEVMSDNVLSSIQILNGGNALSGTGEFTDDAHNRVRFTLQNAPNTPPAPTLTLWVTADATDISMLHAALFNVNFTYAQDSQPYVSPDPTKYTGERIRTQSSYGNLLMMDGAKYEPESGLYFLRARYYDPKLMRFLSPDPEGYSDSPNLYQAMLNNPVNYTDPMGTDARDVASWLGESIEVARDFYTPTADNGGAGYVAADFLSNTIADVSQGTVDMLRVGSSTGEVYGRGNGDFYDYGVAVSQDTSRASALFTTIASPIAVARARNANLAAARTQLTAEMRLQSESMQLQANALKVQVQAAELESDLANQGSRSAAFENAAKQVISLAPQRFSDGSLRWPNGKFASSSGIRPGTPAETNVESAIAAKPGWRVSGATSVRDTNGTLRIYDKVAQSPRGRNIAIEVKSGNSPRTAQQRTVDSTLNSTPGGLPTVGANAKNIQRIRKVLLVRRPR